MSKSITFKVINVDGLVNAIWWLNDKCIKALDSGPVIITLGRESKSRAQEAKYHALIKDITVTSPEYSFDAWKCLLVKWFDEEMKAAGTPLSKPGERILDAVNQEFVYLRPSTTGFKIGEGSNFIEYLLCYGSENNVKWSAQSTDIYNEYKEAQQ